MFFSWFSEGQTRPVVQGRHCRRRLRTANELSVDRLESRLAMAADVTLADPSGAGQDAGAEPPAILREVPWAPPRPTPQGTRGYYRECHFLGFQTLEVDPRGIVFEVRYLDKNFKEHVDRAAFWPGHNGIPGQTTNFDDFLDFKNGRLVAIWDERSDEITAVFEPYGRNPWRP